MTDMMMNFSNQERISTMRLSWEIFYADSREAPQEIDRAFHIIMKQRGIDTEITLEQAIDIVKKMPSDKKINVQCLLVKTVSVDGQIVPKKNECWDNITAKCDLLKIDAVKVVEYPF